MQKRTDWKVDWPMKVEPRARTKDLLNHDEEAWEFRLYVAGETPRCIRAFGNLQKICEHYLASSFRIEVVDLLRNPELAQEDQVLAIPTLVRKSPRPVRRIAGDLSDLPQALAALNLTPARWL